MADKKDIVTMAEWLIGTNPYNVSLIHKLGDDIMSKLDDMGPTASMLKVKGGSSKELFDMLKEFEDELIFDDLKDLEFDASDMEFVSKLNLDDLTKVTWASRFLYGDDFIEFISDVTDIDVLAKVDGIRILDMIGGMANVIDTILDKNDIYMRMSLVILKKRYGELTIDLDHCKLLRLIDKLKEVEDVSNIILRKISCILYTIRYTKLALGAKMLHRLGDLSEIKKDCIFHRIYSLFLQLKMSNEEFKQLFGIGSDVELLEYTLSHQDFARAFVNFNEIPLKDFIKMRMFYDNDIYRNHLSERLSKL